ncbi:hypothetical protein [Paenibacillus sp. OV219]|uniref:hypothetical protein n=1 Tax=Paenibacillus sp. OV219 TaxID=1884377 RepID=UPI0008B0EC41|nr:hypothetical protein [Paenibacillus sp. OV219]SEM73448.1 hypothetical protein SAMN05518847_101652 [Paenibacillus sp. OV219]
MMDEARLHAELAHIEEDDCRVLHITESKHGNTVILYSPVDSCDINARIVYASGVASKRYVNDLNMYVTKVPGKDAWKLQYIRILGDKIGQGYGTIMMEELLRRALSEGIAYIEGRMHLTDQKGHLERLRYFYSKFGFALLEDRRILWTNKQIQHEVTK